MREVISIDNNYIDNTVKKYKTMKQDSNIKGKVTVSLIDNNNVVREVFTENAIMDVTKFTQYLGYTNIGTGGSFLNSNFDLGNMTNEINLLKVADDYEVNPSKCNLKYWEYDLIGYCGKKELYSGADTSKGTYNASESSVYTDENGNIVYHYVYDFPTHSANGTINAIGFGASSTPPVYGPIYNGETTGNLKTVSRTGRVSNQLDTIDSIYYIIPSNTGFELCKYNKYSRELKTVKTVTTKDTTGIQVYRFNHTNKYIVGILFPDKENMIIQKFDLLGELTDETTVSFTTSNGGTVSAKAILDDNEDYLYVYESHKIKAYDVKNGYSSIIEMSVTDEGEEVQTTSSYISYRTIHVDNKYIMITYLNKANDRVRKYYNKKDFTLISKASRKDDSIYYQKPVTYNNDTTIFSNNYGYGYLGGKFMTTLTKLPNSVTKTNIHTMKVQYDIVYTPSDVEDFM